MIPRTTVTPPTSSSRSPRRMFAKFNRRKNKVKASNTKLVIRKLGLVKLCLFAESRGKPGPSIGGVWRSRPGESIRVCRVHADPSHHRSKPRLIENGLRYQPGRASLLSAIGRLSLLSQNHSDIKLPHVPGFLSQIEVVSTSTNPLRKLECKPPLQGTFGQWTKRPGSPNTMRASTGGRTNPKSMDCERGQKD
jgi:hypothetical protein